MTLLYESGVDPLVAMKMVGHRDYQTTANIYTHLKEDSLKKAAADMATVFKKKDAKQAKKAVGGGLSWGIYSPKSLFCNALTYFHFHEFALF